MGPSPRPPTPARAGPAHLGCGVVHNLLGGEVTFVAYQEFIDILAGISIYLLQPLFHVSVGFLGTGSKVIALPNPGLENRAPLKKRQEP